MYSIRFFNRHTRILDANAIDSDFAVLLRNQAAIFRQQVGISMVFVASSLRAASALLESGLISVEHHWCDAGTVVAYPAYPRTFDVIVFRGLQGSCRPVLEIDRLLRPGGYLLTEALEIPAPMQYRLVHTGLLRVYEKASPGRDKHQIH